MNREWVNKSDWLPSQQDVYLVCYKEEKAFEQIICTAIFDGKDFFDEATSNILSMVTHWMDLPEIPQELKILPFYTHY